MTTLKTLLITCLLLCSPLARAEFTLLFLGDSLTEGYGLEPEQSFPHLVGEKLRADGYQDLRIINGGVSGATSASGLNSLQWYSRAEPDFILLSLGANDGLRGLDVAQMRENLARTIRFAQDNDIPIAISGMMIPPNYGEDYSQAFAKVYPSLAEEFDLPLLPFLLDGVAAMEELNLSDGIHPNAAGQEIVAETVYEFLKPLLPPAES